MIEREFLGLFLGEQLHREFPFRERAGVDRLEQVAAVEIVVGALQLHRLVPQRGLQAELRPPVELHEGGLALRVDQTEAVDAEALDHPQRARNAAVAHRPQHHVQGFGGQRDEIPERVVRAGRLREAAIGFHLHRMDEVREFHRVLDGEHRQVVADQVEIAFLGVELDREAAHIAWRIHAAGAARHSGESAEHRDAALLGQEFRGGVLRQRLGELEVAMRRRAARVHDPLGDALMVEVGDLLAEDEVLQQRRPARIRAQRILVVGNGYALRGGQRASLRGGLLVCLAPSGVGVPTRSGCAVRGLLLLGHGVLLQRLGVREP